MKQYGKKARHCCLMNGSELWQGGWVERAFRAQRGTAEASQGEQLLSAIDNNLYDRWRPGLFFKNWMWEPGVSTVVHQSLALSQSRRTSADAVIT